MGKKKKKNKKVIRKPNLLKDIIQLAILITQLLIAIITLIQILLK